MIFVTLGSQKFQFNRLLKKIDELLECGYIREEVFAQIGYSDYKPQNYGFVDFMDRTEFANMIDKASFIVTHGGTGAIIGAVKKGKKVIAVPRLEKYGEHVDDHQLQLVDQFKDLNLISACYDIDSLLDYILNIASIKFEKYDSNTMAIINDIEHYLEEI